MNVSGMNNNGKAIVTLSLILVFVSVANAFSSGNLPGGTAISVNITSPLDGEWNILPPGDTTIDITVDGDASVGQGAVVKDTTVVYVMDNSGSMNAIAGVDCDGIPGFDTRLTCEKEAVEAANTAAAAAQSSVDLTGLASFHSFATAHDVDLGAGGTQLLVAPGHDGNSNTIPDVEDVANSLGPLGNTAYHAGLTRAFQIVNHGSNTNTVNIVIFMSDGQNNIGPHVNTLIGSVPPSTTIHSFAIGLNVNCISGGGLGSLNDVAALSTTGAGTCTVVTNPANLANVITQAIGSSLDSLEISVDGAPATTIPNADIDPDLPQNGPVSVDFSTGVSGLGLGSHDICVTAIGTDAGGEGEVTDCITKIVKRPPQASCVETVNPAGKNTPKAPAKGGQGQNQDGFYELLAEDNEDPDPQIFVEDTGSGIVFGPFPSGTAIKYTEVNGATPSIKPMGGPNSAVDWHIKGQGDAIVYAVDAVGNVGAAVWCRVPPPPK
jgi:hypothetical protein